MLLYHSLAVAFPLLTLSAAQTPTEASGTWPTDLIGTWTTKSNKTLTGPGFYDPLNDKLIEPDRTGISYSFTGDGHYEEAYYRAIANPANPACPSGIMQWQHGSWVMNSNDSLSLTPIAVDGRQLLSEPCQNSNGIYNRYNQSELFQSYEVLTDPYHNIPRLNLFKFDGSPMPPMYLVYSPPEMLPTTTLNPTTASASASATSGSKNSKRGIEQEMPMNWRVMLDDKATRDVVQRINADRLWWLGLSMTGVGGLLYFGPRRLGFRA